jgi:hypothetical protein
MLDPFPVDARGFADGRDPRDRVRHTFLDEAKVAGAHPEQGREVSLLEAGAVAGLNDALAYG